MIESTKNSSGINGYLPINVKQKPAAPRAAEAKESLHTEHTDYYQDKLKEIPLKREEIVALGRKLAQDEAYPSQDAMSKLAQLLAESFQRESEEPVG
ncbi:MAG: hypothetical protein SFY80_13035 [Verrucomicrobiota bacterium]|nr:hypothetical protein [Verrucomicrobiota bacterium]